MIKLIITDMDGTLLDDKKHLPAEFPQILRRLRDRGIQFAVGSGRSYPILRQDFAEYLGELYFICDNGSILLKDDQIQYSSPFSRELTLEISEVCRSIQGIVPVLCGKKSAYHTPCPQEYEGALRSYYNQEHILSDLREFASVEDEILKFAIFDPQGGANHSYPVLNQLFSDRCNVVVSGPYWVDVMLKGVSKGTAVAFLQKKLGISREETMAFGDFYNDVEMLQQAEYSFVMENAEEKMKQYGNYTAPKNTDNGVMRMIQKFIFEGE